MAFRSNQYFNDPGIAQAAANLSSLFAPPSGSDAAGWAGAKAKKDEAQRLQWLFDNYGDPSASQRSALTGVQTYGATPEGFRYNVDQGNATQRYGYDTQAATSRANNVLDNQRSAIGTLYQPLNPGQVRPDVPSDLMGVLGLPEVAAVTGAPKPLSETEVKGGIIQGMDPDLQAAIAFGSTPVESVVTPQGPRIATRMDAIGREPAYAPKGNGTTMTMPDGTVVQVGGDKPITEAQTKLVNYGSTAKAMDDVINQYGDVLTDPLMGASTASPSIGTLNPGNYMQSADYQKARVAGERFVQSILRNESGAATPDAEIAHYNATMLPQPGDKPETTRLKAWARQVAINSLEAGMTLQARKAAVDAALQSGPPPDFATAAPASADAATGAPAAPAPAPTGGIAEGTIIQNDAGDRMVRRGGKWEPM